MEKKTIFGIFVFFILVVLGVCAYFLSGMLLFLSFHQNPLNADWLTPIEAWSKYGSNSLAFGKLKGSIFVSLLVCFAVPFGLIMSMKKKNVDLYGKARFADLNDISSQKFDSDQGITIGQFKETTLKFPGYEFALLAAPTRSGKGVSFVIPNLLTFQDSAVVLDIKGENYNLTSEFRRKYLGQQVFYFNPFSENTHRWNPLSYVSDDPNFRANDLLALATIIYPPDPKNPFWSDSAKNLFLGLGLMVIETPMLPKTIGEMLRQASGKGKPIAEYLTGIINERAKTDRPLSSSCTDCIYRFLQNSDDTLRNIISSFSAPLSIWSNPVIDKATSADDFDLRDVRKKRMTVYIHIPAGNVTQAGFVMNMFFSQLINENVKELPEENPELKHQCLLLMDEFTSIGKIEIISQACGFIAGYNLRLLIIIQDKAQLEAKYGKEEAHNIMQNMGVTIYFTPSLIDEAKQYSEMIGYDTVTISNSQHSNVGSLNVGNYSRSETESQGKRALMLPQELLAMSQNESLIARPGIPIIKSKKIRYYEDPYYLERINAVPTHEVVVNHQKRKVPLPIPLPPAKWLFYHSTIWNSNYYVEGDLSDLRNMEVMEMDLTNNLQAVENAPADQPDAEREANIKALAQSYFEMMMAQEMVTE